MKRFRKVDKETVMIESDRMQEYINYINTNEMVTNVQLNSWYYKETDMNFLGFCPSITKVNNVDCEIMDLSALYEVDQLKVLYSEAPKSELDLSQLKGLKELSINWNKNVLNLTTCSQLEEVSLRGYKPKSKGLKELELLKNVKKLTLVQSSIEHLEGISNLVYLESLNLYYLRNLKNLDEVEGVSRTIKSIDIQNCPNIESYDRLKNLISLEDLRIDTSSKISNLSFVRELKNLKQISICNTDVVDGDLSYLKNTQNVNFTEKNHFSHKMKDFLNEEVQ